jgi:phosphoribosyl 1,2-cyclic phosphodiesterase
MKVRFWGTRGSLATPGHDTLRYGGNTSCAQITGDEGTVLVLDAGTGIREMTKTFSPKLRRVDVLLSHLHMDHIQGLGFFYALYNPEMEVHIWGPATPTLDLRARLMRYLSPPLFPVHLRDLPCKLHIHDGSHMQAEIGEFKVSSWQVCHPGATVGYRIEGPQGTVAYMPDHEPVLGAVRFLPDREWISGISVADGVDMLIHDSQYSDEEYANRIGWGHSSMKQAMEFTKIAEAKMLVPFHHDPTHKDAELEAMFFDAVSEVKPDFPVIPAKEGDTIDLATGLVV